MTSKRAGRKWGHICGKLVEGGGGWARGGGKADDNTRKTGGLRMELGSLVEGNRKGCRPTGGSFVEGWQRLTKERLSTPLHKARTGAESWRQIGGRRATGWGRLLKT